MTLSKIKVDRVTVTAKSRKLLGSWSLEGGVMRWQHEGKEIWNDYMPNHYLLRDLCDKYPGVDGAFKQFESAYALVINDWKLKSGSTANDKLLYAISNYEESWGVEAYELKHMTKEYSVLDKAFEQFKTAWNLVVNDWESSKND